MRFLPPIAALADGPVTFDGDPRARQRPMAPLIGALRTLGVDIDAADGGLPLTVHGAGRVTGGEVTIDASRSSQLVSGLLLAAPSSTAASCAPRRPAGASAPHLAMTVQMLRAAGAGVDDSTPDVWAVEPGRLTGRGLGHRTRPVRRRAVPRRRPGHRRCGDRPGLAAQHHPARRPAARTAHAMGGKPSSTGGLTVRGTGIVHGLDADLSEVGELTPVLAALAAVADSPSRLRGIGHIRGHETDRLAALARELAGSARGHRDRRRPGDPPPAAARRRCSRPTTTTGWRTPPPSSGWPFPASSSTDVACTSKTTARVPGTMVSDGARHSRRKR